MENPEEESIPLQSLDVRSGKTNNNNYLNNVC